MSCDLLLEIGTEDLPARYVAPLAHALAQGIHAGLTTRGIAFDAPRSMATPRRIAVLINAVAAQQAEQTIERLGPSINAALKDGAPTAAGLGFAKSCGVAFEALDQKDGKLHFMKQVAGQTTAALLPEIFADTLKQMDQLVPKRMRWGDGDVTFVRPVQWLTCLLGDQVVPLHAYGLDADRISYGHRFHAPQPITLTQPAEYEDALRKAHVWADVASRKAEVKRQIEAHAQQLGGHVRITDELLDEVTALVEWPVAIVGHFEARYLALPAEVIVATVETNQRYFTVFKDAAQTTLTNAFITLSNIDSRDVSQIISGNERVVRPRLADGLFFWQQDLKQPLAAYGAQLANVTFQKDLGSSADKVARIAALTAELAQLLGSTDATDAVRAATLCKNDLVTKMVFEFPELQGIMGGYYAAKSDESPAVAQAIREHYQPTQHGTPIPSTRAGQLVALADKLDSLAGIFAIGQKPSASKDPYALRRAALGVLRICLEAELPLDIDAALTRALALQPTGDRGASTHADVVAFVMDRLRAHWVGHSLGGRVISADMFESVKALHISHPLDFWQRLRAVHTFTAQIEAPNLAAANKRIRNLLKHSAAPTSAVDPARFVDASEHALFAQLQALEAHNAQTPDYTAQLTALATLRAPVDAFFDAVMVNDPDDAVRDNRLALLLRLDTLCRSAADLSQLPG